jgi:hypothetical protein
MSNARLSQNRAEKMRMIDEAAALCREVSLNVNLVDMCSEFASVGAFRHLVALCATAARQCDPNGLAYRFYRHLSDNNVDMIDTTARELYFRRLVACLFLWRFPFFRRFRGPKT